MRDYADSLINESQVDLESAELLFKGEKYARTVFFAVNAWKKWERQFLQRNQTDF